MRPFSRIVAGALQTAALAIGIAFGAHAQEPGKDLALRGDAECTTCHNPGGVEGHVLEIAKTPHGTTADPRTPTCTSCHGESRAHKENPTEKPDRTFERHSSTPIDARNQACLNCHAGDEVRSHWMGSTHQARGIACTSCHEIHTAHDRVRDRLTQPEVCFTCHKEQRAQFERPSRHPILEGKVVCSDCHNPHGSAGPKLMRRDSINDTCYTCHMEKRGPFVHNHEPVSENCTLCHNPHGTVTENLLKARAPFLCQECHTPHGPNVPQLLGAQIAPNTLTAAGKNAINITMARGCLNCHTEIHGSNNPALTNPSPQFMLR